MPKQDIIVAGASAGGVEALKTCRRGCLLPSFMSHSFSALLSNLSCQKCLIDIGTEGS